MTGGRLTDDQRRTLVEKLGAALSEWRARLTDIEVEL